MRTQFVREGMNNYLVIYDIELWDNEYEINLFRNQVIPYFMTCEPREVNGEAQLYYKLVYRTSLKEALGHISFTTTKIHNIMCSIVKALEVCEEFLLMPENIICTPDNVFMDINTGRLAFGYCPNMSENSFSLKDLVMEILQNVDRRYEKSAIDLLRFYNLLTETDCSIEKLKNMTVYGGKYNKTVEENFEEGVMKENQQYNLTANVINSKTNNVNKIKKKPLIIFNIIKMAIALVSIVDVLLVVGLIFNVLTYEKTGFLFIGMAFLIVLVIIYMQFDPEESQDEMMESFKNEREREAVEYNKYNSINNIQNSDMDGETILLNGEIGEKKQLVKEDTQDGWYLVPVEGKRYNTVCIEKNSMVVGSMAASCDYIIPVKGVSRLHAKISCKNDGVYIMDMNSTNGTYLNGGALNPFKEYKLGVGDMVAFARVQYIISDKNPD